MMLEVKVCVSKQVVDDALLSAHCGYWACDLVWDGKSGFVVEEEGAVRHELTAASVAHGIGELARVSPYIFGKLLDGDLDGPMSDVLLQLCAGVVRTDKGHEGSPVYG